MEGSIFADNQIWENDRYVLKMEKLVDPTHGDQIPTIRAVIFSKTQDQGLRFLEFVWRDEVYLGKLIQVMKLEPTTKKLTLE